MIDMTPKRKIKERLMEFAKVGRFNASSVQMGNADAKWAKSEGIVLNNPKPTKKAGMMSYDIDFSEPVPDTYSQALFNVAVEASGGPVKRPYCVD